MAEPDHSEPLPNSIGKKARPLKACVAGDPNDDAFSLVRAIVSFLLSNRRALYPNCESPAIYLTSLTIARVPSRHQVVKYNVPVSEAILKCWATVSVRAMNNRVRRYRARTNKNSVPESASAKLSSCSVSSLSSSDSRTAANTPSPTSTASSKSATANKSDVALDAIPGWLNREKTSSLLSKRKKRKELEMARDLFASKSNQIYRKDKFKRVWKEATKEYNKSNVSTPSKYGCGARAIAKKYNEQLASPGDYQIGRTALLRAASRGEVGVSPLKRGRPSVVPKELTMAVATHATMMQVSGECEASGAKMKATIEALALGTDWESKVNPEYVWRKTRKEHPEILNPVQAKNHEDRRVDWLSFANINTWTDVAKEYLINLGMLKDEPGEICELILFVLPFCIAK